jgi:hypothetical protein
MAIGAGIFTAVPAMVWTVVHIVTALVGLYYLTKSKGGDKMLTWAFVLYIVSGVLYSLVHLNYVDSYTTHILETVFMLIAFVLIGQHAVSCK